MAVTLAEDRQAASIQDRRSPTTTLQGRRRFVEADPATFTLLPTRQWNGLDEAQRAAYDEDRIRYHSELISSRRPRSGRSCTKAGC